MKCIKCSKSAVTGLKHLGSLCSKCFLKVVEKRIRRDLTVNKVFSPNDKVLVVDNHSLKSGLCQYFLDSISKDIPLKIHVSKTLNAKSDSFDKIVVPGNMDALIESFLECLFTGKEFVFPEDVYLLRSISDEECQVLQKILKFKKGIVKSKLGEKLDLLEKNYPGSKFGLLRFILKQSRHAR